MFFHTHVYFAKKVDKNLDNLKVVGSILPDLAGTSIISWEDLHKKKQILKFFSYVRKFEPGYLSLTKGIHYHNTVDYLSHVKYKNGIGFAFQNSTPQLVEIVAKAFSVDRKRAYMYSHDLIEAGVEYHLLNEIPALMKLVKEAVDETDMEDLAKILADYFKLSHEKMQESLKLVFEIAISYNLADMEEWVKFYMDFNKFYRKIDFDPKLSKEALELSFSITKDSYKDFLSTAISFKDMEIMDAS